MAKRTCPKCGRTKEQTLFYTLGNGQKAELCKDCTLLHVNIWQPQTFVWLLQQYDVPWLPWEWESLRDKAYAKNPQKKNDKTVFGKYLSKMKLKQHKDHHWADTERLQQQHELDLAYKSDDADQLDALYTEQYQNGEITEAQYRTLTKATTQMRLDAEKESETTYQDAIGKDNRFNEEKYMAEEDIPDLGADLTEQDKKYLVMKWGRYYTPQEWVELEKFYTEMTNSFDIQDADTRATLILICKNNLKMNQAIDQGDLEGYQKLARVSDTLRKSAKFTAAQNKEQKSEFIDSIGELVDYCEKNGGAIPRYDISETQDVIDGVLDDLKAYTRSLIYEDTALARQVEEYIQKSERMLQEKKDEEEAKRLGIDKIELSDEDISKYNQQIEKQKEKDAELVREALKNADPVNYEGHAIKAAAERRNME